MLAVDVDPSTPQRTEICKYNDEGCFYRHDDTETREGALSNDKNVHALTWEGFYLIVDAV